MGAERIGEAFGQVMRKGGTMSEMDGLTPERIQLVDRLIDLAIDEDIGEGDATTRALFPSPGHAVGGFVAREAGVMAGGDVVGRFYARMGARFADDAGAVRIEMVKKDGESFSGGDVLLGVSGSASVILMGERVALNLLQRMCGIAARTRQFVERIAGTPAKMYDTRKTTPGHRVLDKLAVRAGGGENHRMGLYDMILIKDNHLAAYGGPAKAVEKARERSSLPVMVEVDTLEQLRDALTAEPDYVLLDNMGPDMLSEAVRLTNDFAAGRGLKRPALEASGGVTLDTVGAVAKTGVERISTSQLTNGAGSVDIGLDFE